MMRKKTKKKPVKKQPRRKKKNRAIKGKLTKRDKIAFGRGFAAGRASK